MPPYLDRLLSRVHHYHLFIDGDRGDAGGGSGSGAADGGAAIGSGDGGDKPLGLGGDDGAAGSGDDGGGGEGEGGSPATLGENWREALAGEDADLLKSLKRFASPANFVKSYREAQAKIRSGQSGPTLPDGATEEEVAAYRKAVGVPEKADAYGFAFPEEMKPTEADTAVLGEFKAFLHARHIGANDPGAKAAFEFYMKSGQAAQETRAAAAAEETQINLAALRQEYPGREFKRNMTIAEEFLGQHFEGSEEALDTVLNATLPNGVKIKNFAPFVKGLVGMARSYADEEALIGGDGAGGGKSIDDEIADLREKSISGKLSKTEDARYNTLLGARISRDQRQGRRAA